MNKIKLSVEQTIAFDALTDHDNPIKRVVYGGQAGGGKSFLISLWQINQRIIHPETRGYLGREILKRLKESTLVTFFDVCKMLDVEFRYNEQKSHIDFSNGSRIVLLDLYDYPSDPNWDSLGSVEFTDGAIDEGVQVSKRCTEILMSRTRYKHDEFGLQPKQLITCNPSESWIKDDIVIPDMEGKLKKSNVFIPATLESNPNKSFVGTYRATLESLTDEFDKARLLHGDWFAQPKTGGEFYKLFDAETNVAPLTYNPALPLHCSFDFNVNPYMTMTIHQMEGKTIHQIDEMCLSHPNNTTPAICREFVRKYSGHKAGLFVYGDPSGKQADTRNEKGHNDFNIIMDKLSQFKPQQRVDSSAPPVTMRGNFINELFCGRIDGCEFLIDESCEHTIADYNFVMEAMDGTKAKKKIKNPHSGVSYEKYGHTSDSNDYFICRVFSDEFRSYMTGNREIKRKLAPRRKSKSF